MARPNEMKWDVVVIGAGAAGLLAAARCAEHGFRTLLLEKNRKPGVKILMSGGTRCNLTHNTDAAGIMQAFGRKGRFLRTALQTLGPRDVVELFRQEGVTTKVEETGKIFPESDRALDVQQALLARLRRSEAVLRLDTSVTGIEKSELGFVIRTADSVIHGDNLIISTGGASYPGCGTTGDGYAWLRALGHKIVPPRPSLVPLTTREPWVAELSGVTLPDVMVRVMPRNCWPTDHDPPTRLAALRKKSLDERRGSVLFTHFGLSGPSILDVSRSVTAQPDMTSVDVVLDLLPDRSFDDLDEWWRKVCTEHGSRSIVRMLSELVPQRLAEALLKLEHLPPDLRGAELTKPARRSLAGRLKSLGIPVSGTRGFAKAEVTAGGVSLDEVDPRTMASKIVPGLYVIGEILDLDGWIGGFNFQSAFSTAWLAAESIHASRNGE